jgi:hypothetical protein
MKNSKFVVVLFASLLIFATSGHAQTMYQVTLKGTCQTTNDAGDIITQQINNKTLIQDAVNATGATNASSLNLVYIQNASSDPNVPADFIAVINTTNSAPVYTNLQFHYGGSEGQVLTNAAGNEIVANAEVLPLPLATGNPTGFATINERILPKKTLIRGSFNYAVLLTPQGSNTVQICNGTFSIGKPVTP